MLICFPWTSFLDKYLPDSLQPGINETARALEILEADPGYDQWSPLWSLDILRTRYTLVRGAPAYGTLSRLPPREVLVDYVQASYRLEEHLDLRYKVEPHHALFLGEAIATNKACRAKLQALLYCWNYPTNCVFTRLCLRDVQDTFGAQAFAAGDWSSAFTFLADYRRIPEN